MSNSDLAPAAQILRLGAYSLDPIRNVLICEAREAPLTPLASRLLQLLAAKPGEIYDRADIIDKLWRGDWMVGDSALNRLISEIRSAARDDKRKPTLIQTVPRRGYRLVASVESPAPIAQVLEWPRAWKLANVSLAIAFGGFALILALAILARLFR